MGTECNNWRDLLQCYTQETTLHGISHVTARHKSRAQRLLWALLFLSALSCFLYGLVVGLIRFYSYPVDTHMEYELQASLPFPSVTLCNYNYVTKTYVASLNNPYIKMAIDSRELGETSYNFSDPVIIQEMTAVKMDHIGANSAHSKEQMFLACDFRAANYSEFPCQFHEDLLVSVSTQHGFCYTFNPQSYIEKRGEVMSDRAGKKGGLYFLVNIQQEEYMVANRAAGMKVLVHDPKDEPLMQDLAYSIQPGTETNLVITKAEIHNLPPPYQGSSCVDTNPKTNSSFVNPLKHYAHYSFAACKMECRRTHIVTECHCVGYTMKPEPGDTVCNVYEYTTCVLPAFDSYSANSSIESACGCFRPCEETKYTVTQSSAYFPADYILHDLEAKYNLSKEYFRKNTMELNIYYGELGHTRIIQRSDYPPSSLFAEVGGLCGLFLGASLLTLAELADVCAAVLALVCRESGKEEHKSETHHGC